MKTIKKFLIIRILILLKDVALLKQAGNELKQISLAKYLSDIVLQSCCSENATTSKTRRFAVCIVQCILRIASSYLYLTS